MSKISREDFTEFMGNLLEMLFEAGESAAEEAGHPVNAIPVLEKALVEEGLISAEQIEAHPCFSCMSGAKIIIDAEGNVVYPDDEEDEE